MTREQRTRLLGLKPAALVETYHNTLAGDADYIAPRWWADPTEMLLVGGSILSAGDWWHLRDDLGIRAVLSVESERDDSYVLMPSPPHVHLPTPDNGVPSIDLYTAALKFARTHARERIYVHCQMGSSRSVAFAYAIMRSRGYAPPQILERFRTIFSRAVVGLDWGEHPFHMAYVGGAEAGLARFFLL